MLSATPDLAEGPFTVARARQEGLSWHDLQTRNWMRLSRGQYASSSLPLDVRLKLLAVHERMPDDYAFSGPTAAWIFGLDMAPCEPIEVTIGRDLSVRSRAGTKLRRASLPAEEVTTYRGFRVTSPLRTVRDLGSRRDLVESVVALDMALHFGLVDLKSLETFVDCHAGAKGIRRLRRAVRLAQPATESPMETRLRLQLIKARLPVPSVQTNLQDSAGRFVARADLYYSDYRLVIEFDGEHHKDHLNSDLRRQNALISAGYHILRFTAGDLRRPGAVADQVRRARVQLARNAR